MIFKFMSEVLSKASGQEIPQHQIERKSYVQPFDYRYYPTTQDRQRDHAQFLFGEQFDITSQYLRGMEYIVHSFLHDKIRQAL